MVPVDWTEPAIQDLRDIYDFIARDSLRYARLTVERIRDSAGVLGRFPRFGEVLAEFPHLAYRQIVVGSYRLIYREQPEVHRVIVMAVIHSSRDLFTVRKNR